LCQCVSIRKGCGHLSREREQGGCGSDAVPAGRSGQTVAVDLKASVELGASPERVRPLVASLDCYPQWLSIVARAEPLDGTADAWEIELRAKVGPLSRSKRLRMVRTVDDPSHLRFERFELDGRTHADWTLDVRLRPEGDQTDLTMELHYGGGFGGGVVERLLASEIEESRKRLRALLDHDAAAS